MRTTTKTLLVTSTKDRERVVLFTGISSSSRYIFSARVEDGKIRVGIAGYHEELRNGIKEYEERISPSIAKDVIAGRRRGVVFLYRSEPSGNNVTIGCTTFRKSTLRAVMKRLFPK